MLTAPPTTWDTRAPQAGVHRQMADFVEAHRVDRLAEAEAPLPPVFDGLEGFPPPGIEAALVPAVLRGAGRSDLPPLESLAAIVQPTLILVRTDDPGRPSITAERLAATLPDAVLEVAATRGKFLAWSSRPAAFVTARRPRRPPIPSRPGGIMGRASAALMLGRCRFPRPPTCTRSGAARSW